jgi:hypothetical protein
MATGLVTLNPSDALNCTLSGGNLVATGTGSAPPAAVRGVNGQSAGLYYFEAVVSVGTAGDGIGVAGSVTALSAVAAGTNAAMIYVTYYAQGPVFVNGVQNGQINQLGTGDTVSVVLDINRSLVYFRDSTIDPTYGWNAFPAWNNGGNTNPNLPVLGTGAAVYTAFGPGTTPVFPMWFFMPNRAVAQQVTLVTAPGSMYGQVPSGFSTLGASAWDPAKTVGTGVVLSNANMTANVPAGTVSQITVIGTVSMTAGKYYFEVQVDAIDTTTQNNNNGVGISDGANAHTVTVRGNQEINQDNTGLLTIGADSFQWYSGMRIAVALDLTAGKIWYRNLGAQPSAGIGGISIAGMTGPFLPAGILAGPSHVLGYTFSAASFVGTVPSGVSVWPGLYQPDVFSPPNISLPIIRERGTDTRTASVASGKRWRSPLRQYPTIRWTLTFEALTSLAAYQGLVSQGWQYLEGFIVDQSGPFQEFLFQDIYTPDYQISGGLIGTGDGVTTNFTISRALRNTHEPVGWVNQADVSNVSVGGVTQASGWSILSPNILSFATAPAAGKAITITCNYYWRCTFTEDTASMDAFMLDLLDFKELKFESLPSSTAANL